MSTLDPNDPSPIQDLEQVGSARPLDLPTKDRPYNPQEHLDKTTAWLAGSLVGILAVTVLFSFVVVAIWPDREKSIHDLLTIVFTPLVALVASAVGFYFARKSAPV